MLQCPEQKTTTKLSPVLDFRKVAVSEMFFMGLILPITIFASMAVPRKTRLLLFVESKTQKLCLQALQLNDIRQFGWQILKVKSEF